MRIALPMTLRQDPAMSAGDDTVWSKLDSEHKSLRIKRFVSDFEITVDSFPAAYARIISDKTHTPMMLFTKICIQGVITSRPVGFKRSFEEGLVFGGVMA